MRTEETEISSEKSLNTLTTGASDHVGFRMTSSRMLLLLSITLSLIFLLSGSAPGIGVVFKVSSIALLAFLGFRVSKLLGIALSFGALGDLLLGVSHLGPLNSEQLFLFGLGAFLVGHLFYIAMFVRLRSRKWRHSAVRELAVLAILLTLGIMLMQLQQFLGSLLIPVILYAVVLAGMAISAQFVDLGNPLAAIGALCFVASDAMLAIGKFREPFPASSALIWITYYLAQLLIYLGVARGSLRTKPRL